MGDFELRTARLVIRPWQTRDLEPFAALNADPVVMEFFPATLSAEQSEALVQGFRREFDECGFCPWAVVEQGSDAFIGFVGLHRVPDALPCAPAVEVGWRLARRFWGAGYATEAAGACLDHAFGPLGLDEVVSFTSVPNGRSRRVMERLGLRHDVSGDFEHPAIPAGHPLRPHVLYRTAAGDRPGPDAAG